MKVVCSYCSKILQEGVAEMVSHGICPPCYASVMDTLVRLGHVSRREANLSIRKVERAEEERAAAP